MSCCVCSTTLQLVAAIRRQRHHRHRGPKDGAVHPDGDDGPSGVAAPVVAPSKSQRMAQAPCFAACSLSTDVSSCVSADGRVFMWGTTLTARVTLTAVITVQCLPPRCARVECHVACVVCCALSCMCVGHRILLAGEDLHSHNGMSTKHATMPTVVRGFKPDAVMSRVACAADRVAAISTTGDGAWLCMCASGNQGVLQ